MHTPRRFLMWTAAAVVFVVSTVQAVEVGDVVTLSEVQSLDGTRVPGDTRWGYPVIIAT